MMRDDEWLETRFNQIWQLFFPDVEKRNISIRWKGRWKNKFGHITSRKKEGELVSEIVVNKLFRDVRVPEEVIKVTIAHEIVHYMHGFHSHLPRKYRHPHQGGIVNKELVKRGFHHEVKREREWHKKEWLPIFREYDGAKRVFS